MDLDVHRLFRESVQSASERAALSITSAQPAAHASTTLAAAAGSASALSRDQHCR